MPTTEFCLLYRTALMLAALGCHTDCVHILLEKNAKPDAADKQGFTALHRAVSVCMSHVTFFHCTHQLLQIEDYTFATTLMPPVT